MNAWFEVKESTIQGKGAFAAQLIPKGMRIIEYTGERISEEEAQRRYDDAAMNRHHTFLFDLEDGTCLDGAVNGNESIYINHSCDPNCVPEIENGKIFIYALRDIKPGEELCYDYAYEREGEDNEDAIYPCRCGSGKCRGTILAPKEEV